MSTLDGDGACVLLWNTDTVLFCSNLFFTDCLVGRVIYFARASFINRLAYRVIDLLRLGLVDGFTNGVFDGLFARFVNRLLDRVVDRTLMSFVHGLANRVFDRFLASFVYRTTNRVVDYLLMLFINRLAHGVIDFPGPSLILWNHNRVIDFPGRRFRNQSTALNLTIFVVDLISRSVSRFLNLIVHDLTYRTHAGVRAACCRLNTVIISLSDSAASTTAFIADRAALCSIRGISTGHDRADHDCG